MTPATDLETQSRLVTPASGGSETDEQACMSALKPAFDQVTAHGAVSMGSAAGAEIPDELLAVIDDATARGWDRDTAENAVRALAREQLGAHGAAFD